MNAAGAEFESSTVERAAPDRVVIALFDGAPLERVCVGLFTCRVEAAVSLWRNLGSAAEME